MAEILLAEDDKHIREWLPVALEGQGHHVHAVADGAAALTAYAQQRPDLMLLDVMMPKKSGYTVCTEIRKTDKTLPIIMLTAKTSEADKVLGLEIGADDYLTKPFGIRELIARVSALLRRARALETEQQAKGWTALPCGAHELDLKRHTLRTIATQQETPLTTLEFGLLRLLLAHPGEILTRDRLLNELWGVSYLGSTRTLDQHVALVRKKLDTDAALIETVYGTGYRFNPPSQSPSNG